MGGNVFEKTSAIKQELIEPTINRLVKELTLMFPNLAWHDRFIRLGSTGKKPVSNDIDLGLDIKQLIPTSVSCNVCGIKHSKIKETYQLLKSRARTATQDELLQRAFLIELGEEINYHSELIECDLKKITSGSIFLCFPQFDDYIRLDAYVQIDILIGDIDWLRFSYEHDSYPTDSIVKGLHQTQAKVALFKLANLTYSHTNGIKDCRTHRFITNNPSDALYELSRRLNLSIGIEDINSFDKIYDVITTKLSNAQLYDWLDIYLKILDSTRCDIPLVFQKEWIARQDRLDLKGKFLPIDSMLYSHVKKPI